MKLQSEIICPEQITAFRDIVVGNNTATNPNGTSYLRNRLSQEFSPICLYSQSVFTDNQPRQEITRVIAEDILDQQFQYLSSIDKELSQTDSKDFVESFLAGLLYKDKADTNRVVLTKQMLQEAVKKKDKKQLMHIYASKCGDFVRAFFDSSPPNEKIAVNVLRESQTLAMIRILLEDNQGFNSAVSKGQIAVNDFKKLGVCDDFSSAGVFEEIWKQRTIDILRQNLHLVNATAAISQANTELARNVFADGGAIAHATSNPFIMTLQQLDGKFIQRYDAVYVYGRLPDNQLLKVQNDFSKVSSIFTKK